MKGTPSRRLLRLFAMLTVGLGGCDRTAPRWPAEASVRVQTRSSSSVEASWPDASDAQGVERYEVIVNGSLKMETRSTQILIGPLSRRRGTRVSVVALDAAGNRSIPLPGELRADDDAPPRFAPTAELHVEVEPIGPEAARVALRLRWPPATDNVGVAEYYVMRGGELAQRTRGLTAILLLTDDAAAQPLGVVAVDFADNRSVPLRAEDAPPVPAD